MNFPAADDFILQIQMGMSLRYGLNRAKYSGFSTFSIVD